MGFCAAGIKGVWRSCVEYLGCGVLGFWVFSCGVLKFPVLGLVLSCRVLFPDSRLQSSRMLVYRLWESWLPGLRLWVSQL